MTSSAKKTRPAGTSGTPAPAPVAAAQAPAPSRGAVLTLISLASAETALAIFQWIELVIVRQGGSSVCAVNETVNCERVWNSAGAVRLSQLFGVPVAGLGLAWGLAAIVVSLLLFFALRDGRPWHSQSGALWVLSGAGVGACIAFALLSFAAQGLCLTCLATYALVLAFAVVTLLAIPRAGFGAAERARTLLWAVVPPFAAYVLLLIPGAFTPKAPSQAVQAMANAATAAKSQPAATTGPDAQLSSFIDQLSDTDKQRLAAALAQYKAAPQLPTPPARNRLGPADAPMKIVEFTDIRCPHCRVLVEAMDQIMKLLPPGTISVEARNFPLDKECNPGMGGSDGTGTRCAGAKAQICLEQAPDFWDLRRKLFVNQAQLTPEKVVEIGSEGVTARGPLQMCMASQDTAQKLSDDLAFAVQYHPEGTPIVIINGKNAPPYPALLYALALARGNPDSPAFAKLPAPSGMAGE